MIHKIRQLNHPIWTIALLICVLIIGLCTISTVITEQYAHIAPEYPKQDISAIVQKESFTSADYKLIMQQTGLGKQAIDHICQSDFSAEKLLLFQKQFFQEITYSCKNNSIISKEESIVDANGKTQYNILLAPLENGDILLTKASHTYGWRNGHAAVVIDAEQGKTLESVVLGTNSCIQDVNKWKKYPNFMILRLKNITSQQQNKIAADAYAYLNNIPYDFTVGLLSAKTEQPGYINGTQCAHLVWQAYQFSGYDLDSDGGIIVTPKDIANSPLLEIVQVYGVNPEELWP